MTTSNPPPKGQAQVIVRVPIETARRWKVYAAESGRSMKEIVTTGVEKEIEAGKSASSGK